MAAVQNVRSVAGVLFEDRSNGSRCTKSTSKALWKIIVSVDGASKVASDTTVAAAKTLLGELTSSD